MTSIPGNVALAIGEHAFRAGFAAAAAFAEGGLAIDGEVPMTNKATAALEAAWSAYDPPEDIKALTR
jgi:hypothetical protein